MILADIVFQHEQGLQRIKDEITSLPIISPLTMDPVKLHLEITAKVNLDLAPLLERFSITNQASSSGSIEVGDEEGPSSRLQTVDEKFDSDDVENTDQLSIRITHLEYEVKEKDQKLNRVTAHNQALQSELQTEKNENQRISKNNKRMQDELFLMTENKKSFENLTGQLEKLRKFIGSFESRIQEKYEKLDIGINNVEDEKLRNFINSVVLDAEKMKELVNPVPEWDNLLPN